MRVALFAGLVGLTSLSNAGHVPRDYNNNDYYVLQIHSTGSPEEVASRLGFKYAGTVGDLPNHYVFSSPKSKGDVVRTEILENKKRKRRAPDEFDVLDKVLFSAKQELRRHLHKRVIPPPPPGMPRGDAEPIPSAVKKQQTLMNSLGIRDPIFTKQWHLFNSVEVGHDVNVTGAWMEGVTGKNATVAIVDDGLDMTSDDLKANYFAEGSYDFNDHDEVPAPVLADDHHGTRCAGEVAAVRNNVCGIGVAYEAKVAGIRILSAVISDEDEAKALMYKNDKNQIYSCSWGPSDDGRTMEAPSVLIRRAMLTSIQKGRNGLGSIFVFASGNGARSGDNCNFDGYTNSIFSITVGAVSRDNQQTYYSEPCSAQLVVTYSSGGNTADGFIHTTDVGQDKCTDRHGGTSAAAPLAAGIFALVLEVRPDLTWRDLQYLVMNSAKPFSAPGVVWNQTSIGKQFSHVFGYGNVDTYDLVRRARTWETVKPQAWFFSPRLEVNQAIPQGPSGVGANFTVTKDMLKEANLERLEHVTIFMNANHTRRGDLSVDLISPNNMVSHLATTRSGDEHQVGYVNWTFMSVAHWGESGVGTWTLVARDTVQNNHVGIFTDWRLKLWGESIDASKATQLGMPTEDEYVTQPATEIPTSTAGSTATSSATATATATATAAPTSTSPPAWFPGFGSKTAMLWVVGAAVIIALFCVGLCIYLFVARKRRNTPRDDYEFELLDEEEADGLNGNEKGGEGRRTRGGELYDAFAAASEDEDEFEEYRDPSAERLAGTGGQGDQYVVGEESDDEGGPEAAEARPLGGGRPS
ncbi:kexin-like protease [Metarhizium album ARSEF 1941]|uniref:Kexin-like protease n=1 Tax=Metarhizium album (strain ARSEF 1941) TaxID=1081103 RepID=A0A0B2WL72_METAS|nr:kexin-like protease [Metarhizium album ARSEF 1941]KHN94698.1 kexin-like protease [Metarhizium album ARSEF 1941]